ncbi:MAG: hypothetical protein LBU58_05255, partial [Clostridiales bacterium]|nr:hypothetical protein [Clostridiales bacterium]
MRGTRHGIQYSPHRLRHTKAARFLAAALLSLFFLAALPPAQAAFAETPQTALSEASQAATAAEVPTAFTADTTAAFTADGTSTASAADAQTAIP